MISTYGDRAAREVSQRIGAGVATTAEMTAIPTDRRIDKMLIVAAGQLYRFDSSATAAGAGTFAPDAGTGAWIAVNAAAADYKDSVKAATTANLSATRTANVLEADANGALGTIDGVTMAVNDRVLIKSQSTGADNGIYTVTSLGAGGAKYKFTRAADADTSAKLTSGVIVPVTEGTVNGDKLFQLTTNDAITLNTTSLTFAIGGAGLSATTPTNVAAAAVVGTETAASHGDHAHADPNRAAAGTALTDSASQTIQSSEGFWRKLATLSQGGTLTLGTVAAAAGDQITVTRAATGAFTYAIANGGAGAGTLYTFVAGQTGYAEFQFDGTNWALKGHGQLVIAATTSLPGTMSAADKVILDALQTKVLLKKSQVISYDNAALVAESDDGDAVSINIDTALPAGALVLGWRATIATPFAGAGLASLALDVGLAGGGQVASAFALLGTAAGQYAGASVATGVFSGAQLTAEFTPDGAAATDELTAGSLTIDVYYLVAF